VDLDTAEEVTVSYEGTLDQEEFITSTAVTFKGTIQRYQGRLTQEGFESIVSLLDAQAEADDASSPPEENGEDSQ
jgi:hypothetical protein